MEDRVFFPSPIGGNPLGSRGPRSAEDTERMAASESAIANSIVAEVDDPSRILKDFSTQKTGKRVPAGS